MPARLAHLPGPLPVFEDLQGPGGHALDVAHRRRVPLGCDLPANVGGRCVVQPLLGAEAAEDSLHGDARTLGDGFERGRAPRLAEQLDHGRQDPLSVGRCALRASLLDVRARRRGSIHGSETYTNAEFVSIALT